jgi:hypothetical protein
MRWEDILWDESRMIVRSPKTEHHEGKDSRVIPIFPELKPHLEAVWDQAEEGAEYVITRYRNPKQNLRTTFNKIIKRAGLKPWPKLFHNLRATRETELAESFPMHVVCNWIGNSQLIAAKHYLQTTDEHFDQALQNAVQYPAVYGETGEERSLPTLRKESAIQGNTKRYSRVQNDEITPQGFEPWLTESESVVLPLHYGAVCDFDTERRCYVHRISLF